MRFVIPAATVAEASSKWGYCAGPWVHGFAAGWGGKPCDDTLPKRPSTASKKAHRAWVDGWEHGDRARSPQLGLLRDEGTAICLECPGWNGLPELGGSAVLDGELVATWGVCPRSFTSPTSTRDAKGKRIQSDKRNYKAPQCAEGPVPAMPVEEKTG